MIMIIMMMLGVKHGGQADAALAVLHAVAVKVTAAAAAAGAAGVGGHGDRRR